MEKKTGYALLWGGIVIILCTVLLTWRVFTGAEAPPALVDIREMVLPLGGNQLTLPLNPHFSKIMNMSIYFMLMLFISGAGSKISNLGVKLLKEDAKKPAP